ncbi:MAG: 2,3-dehydroadipyl-CoA hydratase [Phycisphaerae bacterium]|nr:2,3-dehydroadipyl-CoA hydratase [Phycisphaerae bacterium]
MSSLLAVEELGGWRIVTLWRPEKRNALNTELLIALQKALDTAAKDGTRVLLLTGQGSAFCAGLDINELTEEDRRQHPPDLLRHLQALLHSIEQMDSIVIAAINGFAVGGGAALMTACDLVVASEHARIGYPELRNGRVAALVMPALLRQVGERQARNLLLTGELITSTRALQMGLVDEITKPADLLPRCRRLAEDLLLIPPEAVSRTKRWLFDCSTNATENANERELRLYLPHEPST